MRTGYWCEWGTSTKRVQTWIGTGASGRDGTGAGRSTGTITGADTDSESDSRNTPLTAGSKTLFYLPDG